MNHTIFQVANEFFKLAKGKEREISNLKLNKLMYIAQGFSLGLLDVPLFEEDIEAWEEGPVIPIIYYKYRGLGKHTDLLQSDFNIDFENGLEEGSNHHKIVKIVFALYGTLEGWELTDRTHRKGTPWDLTFNNGETKIGKMLIKDYYNFYLEELNSHLIA